MDTETARVVDHNCTRCLLGTPKLRNKCIAPEWTGTPGGLLVVSDYPGKTEDNVGRPLAGPTGRYLRPLLKRLWSGPITLDNGIKCAPGTRAVTDTLVAKCRGYLSQTLAEAQPTKILAMGRTAILALTGRSLAPMSMRKGYGWVRVAGQLTPVYYFMNPVNAVRNRFLRQWFEEDLQWALTTDPPYQPVWDGTATVIEDEADALEVACRLQQSPWFAFDIESAGKMWSPFQVVCVSVALPDSDSAWVWADKGLADPGAVAVLARLLHSGKIGKVGSNVKYDQNGCLVDLGVRTNNIVGDLRLVRRLLEPDASGYLEDMAELVGMGGHKEEANQALVTAGRVVAQIGRDNVKQVEQLGLLDNMVPGLRQDVKRSIRPGERTKIYAYGVIDRDICIRYNALDSISTAWANNVVEQRREADEPNLTTVYHGTVLPAARAVAQMEEWGVCVDTDSIQHFHEYLVAQKVDLLRKLQRGSWEDFNPESHDDKRKLLFDNLKLPSSKKTEGGKESVDKEALAEIVHLHPLVGDLQRWAKISKLDSTYATGLLQHIRDDGRIHPSINLDGAGTGRPSCSEPNLQTLPRDKDSEEGKMVRDCFVAPAGHVLVSMDYSQIELRVAAMLSGDPVMTRLFEEGRDFHQATAEQVFGSDSGPVERTKAKAVNFGLLYGQGDHALSRSLGCSKAEAGKIRSAVLGEFKVLARWLDDQLKLAQRTGCVWTWWAGGKARRRPLWRLASQDKQEQSTARNATGNTPIQGTASEYCVRSMTEAVEWVVDEGIPAKIVLPIHDSIVGEVREDCLEEYVTTVHDIMTSWDSQGVPILVDVEVGRALGSLEKYQVAAA